MALTDLILFPVYVLIFYLIFSARRKRITDPVLRRYHLHGFWIKVLGTVAFTFFHLFITRGDTTALYYTEGINITKLILQDITNVKMLFTSGKHFDENLLADSFNRGYFKNESNYFITILVSFFSFFTFGSYSVINLVFSLISFSGVWRLYKFFYEQYPKLHRQLAIAIIYLPTFIFWSSGILKDPLCTGMLGWFTYSVYCAFIKRTGFTRNIIIAVISGAILGLVKSYILVAYIPFFTIYLVMMNLKQMQQTASKIILLGSLIFIGGGVMALIAGKLQEVLGNLALDKLTESVKTTQQNFMGIAELAESAFTLGVEFDGTPESLVKIAPAAVTASLFRPYLWESKKISTLLSSLESLAFMLFTLYVFLRAGPIRFLARIFNDPMIMYCFFFAILFALFVGATTLNFGTLVRYKIPCLPFYLIALILILEKSKEHKRLKQAAKNTRENN
ncbi:MAG TPA: hypothetical protein PKC39_00695 [Ferruginibacter sp.]|nr:hypothetical protein [Ferruginibacter sp.]HMP19449.1 hypothetical protein [Ferruginibacter sp.]